MEDKSNSKLSLLTVGGIGILGTLLGGIASSFLLQSAVGPKGPLPKTAAPILARVTLNDDGTCTQRVKGIRFAFPVLVSGAEIQWQGQDGRSGHGGAMVAIDVEFDPNVTPFGSASFISTNASPTPSSGQAVKGADDYPFKSITIAGAPCTLSDPGVHIDQ